MRLLTQIIQANNLKINYPTCQVVVGQHDQQQYRCGVWQANLSIRVINLSFLRNHRQSEVEVPLNEEHSHSPSAPPLFNQAFQSQRATGTCSSSNISYVSHSTGSIGTGMVMRDSAENTPTSQNMYEYICEKIKGWCDRAFNYLFTRRQIIWLFELETVSSSCTLSPTEIIDISRCCLIEDKVSSERRINQLVSLLVRAAGLII